jgi:hypothetical protein
MPLYYLQFHSFVQNFLDFLVLRSTVINNRKLQLAAETAGTLISVIPSSSFQSIIWFSVYYL